MQLVSAIKPESEEQVQYSWSISLEDAYTMEFDLKFKNPEFISSNGVDRDQFRIFFVETNSYIQCELGETQDETQAGRRLLEETE